MEAEDGNEGKEVEKGTKKAIKLFCLHIFAKDDDVSLENIPLIRCVNIALVADH